MKTTTVDIGDIKCYHAPNNRTLYLADDVLRKDGKPIEVRWLDVDDVLRDAERENDLSDHTLELYGLCDFWTAAVRRLEYARFPQNIVWLRHLVLQPHAPTETKHYVVVDKNDSVLKETSELLLLDPIETRQDGRKVIVVNQFNFPYIGSAVPGNHLYRNTYYHPEHVDPKSGFVTQFDPNSFQYNFEIVGHPVLLVTKLCLNGSVSTQPIDTEDPYVGVSQIRVRVKEDAEPDDLKILGVPRTS